MIPESGTTEITDRIAKLKSDVLSAIPTVCTERAGIYTGIYQEFENSPLILIRAYALEKTLKKMTIFINEGEMIVGNQSSKLRAAPLFPEYGTSWILNELDEFDKREHDAFFINTKQKEEIKRISNWWNGKTLSAQNMEMHDSATIKAEGNFTICDAHIAVNFEKVLEIGLKGYLQIIEKHQKNLKESDDRFFQKQDFYNSLIVGIKAFQTFIERFERLAYEMAECDTEPVRKSELFKISEICGNITENPPSGFHEALQLTWFIQLLLQIESNVRSISLGRMDQYLYRFYKSDLITGKITEEFALELLENTWIKLLTINKIRSCSHTRYSEGGSLCQNVTIGGQTKEGTDAVNELSYLILDSVGRMQLTQPNLSVRFHKNISDDFLEHCISVANGGFGGPAFNNDEIVITSLIDLGISKDQAYNYSAIGHFEIAVPGESEYTGLSFINFMRGFLAVFHNSLNKKSVKTFHKGTGEFKEFVAFTDIMNSWKEQIALYTRAAVETVTAVDLSHGEMVPDILFSVFVDDCISCEKTIKSGLQVSFTNPENYLPAIKKLVFEDYLTDGNDDDVDLLLREAVVFWKENRSRF